LLLVGVEESFWARWLQPLLSVWRLLLLLWDDGDGSVVEELGCCYGVLQVWLAAVREMGLL